MVKDKINNISYIFIFLVFILLSFFAHTIGKIYFNTDISLSTNFIEIHNNTGTNHILFHVIFEGNENKEFVMEKKSDIYVLENALDDFEGKIILKVCKKTHCINKIVSGYYESRFHYKYKISVSSFSDDGIRIRH